MEMHLKTFAFILASEHEGKLLFLVRFLEVFNLNSYTFNNLSGFNSPIRLHLTLVLNSIIQECWDTMLYVGYNPTQCKQH